VPLSSASSTPSPTPPRTSLLSAMTGAACPPATTIRQHDYRHAIRRSRFGSAPLGLLACTRLCSRAPSTTCGSIAAHGPVDRESRRERGVSPERAGPPRRPILSACANEAGPRPALASSLIDAYQAFLRVVPSLLGPPYVRAELSPQNGCEVMATNKAQHPSQTRRAPRPPTPRSHFKCWTGRCQTCQQSVNLDQLPVRQHRQHE
jgi:hypothetical protein